MSKSESNIISVLERANTQGELPSFDKKASQALKGIAILMMLFHHCFRDTSLFENFAISFIPFHEEYVVKIAYICKICVSIFAFISGYGLYCSYENKKTTPDRWVLTRYVKTFSGYWFIWLIAMIVSQLLNKRYTRLFFKTNLWQGIAETIVDFSGTATLFNTGTLCGTWWYMSAAFVYIIMTALLYGAIKEKPCTVFLLSIIFTRVIFSGHDKTYFTGGNSIYSFFAVFLCGAVFARLGLLEFWFRIGTAQKWHKAVKLLLEVLAILVMSQFYANVRITQYWEMHFCFAAVLIILFCLEFVIPIPFLRDKLAFLGKHSMNIYLVHTFIRGYYLNEFTYSWRHFILVVIILLLISLSISIVLEWLKKVTGYSRLVSKFCQRITEKDPNLITHKE